MSPNDKPLPDYAYRFDSSFGRRPADPGEWAYDHRVGLCVTVILCLLAGIMVMTTKIVLGFRPMIMHEVHINLEEEFAQERPPEEQIREIERGSDDFSQVRNRISNDNADQTGSGGLNASLRDDRGTYAQDLYDKAAAVQQRSAANRRAYEEGLEQERRMSSREARSSVESQVRTDTRSQGRVTVSFSLVNPLRHSMNLFIPAYLCEGGGEIIIGITVNRNGDVIAASPRKASSSVDECISTTAVNAALRSRFNVDASAPEKQQGTITYIFIPQ